MQERRQPEVIAGRVGSAGEIITGDGYTCTRTALGTYVLRFPPSFRPVGISVIVVSSGSVVFISSLTESSYTVSPMSLAGAAVDVSFTFVAVGAQQ